jgi:hypothetical protein
VRFANITIERRSAPPKETVRQYIGAGVRS